MGLGDCASDYRRAPIRSDWQPIRTSRGDGYQKLVSKGSQRLAQLLSLTEDLAVAANSQFFSAGYFTLIGDLSANSGVGIEPPS